MVVVKAVERKVAIYRSANLKEWSHLSDFGPAGAVGGVWECPDLFPLAVDGNPRNVKWVMVVNLNPGSIAGGSGGQYFVGDFDGTTFTSDDPRPTPRPPAPSSRTSRVPPSVPGPPPEPPSDLGRPPARSTGSRPSRVMKASSWRTASTTGTAPSGL